MKSYLIPILLFLTLISSCDKSEHNSIFENWGELSFELRVDKELISSRSALPVVPDEINLDIVPDDKATGTEKRYMLSSTNGVFKRKSKGVHRF